MNQALAKAIRKAQAEKWEAGFLLQIRAAGLPLPEAQVRFHPDRAWRWDYAWREPMIAVELMGSVWSQGRHTRGAGYEEDCVKANEGVRLGWRVLRFTGSQVETGAALRCVEALFAALEPSGPENAVESA